MQEESDLDILLAITDLLAQHLRQQHEMVIMHPDQIAILDFLRDGLCEKAICLLVSFPGRFVEGDFAGVVVEQRPENRVCSGRSAQLTPSLDLAGLLTGESVVMAVCEVIVDKHRHCAVLVLQAPLDHGDLFFGHLQTGPTVPLEGC